MLVCDLGWLGAADFSACSLTEVEFWIARGIAAGKLTRV